MRPCRLLIFENATAFLDFHKRWANFFNGIESHINADGRARDRVLKSTVSERWYDQSSSIGSSALQP